MSNKQAIIDNFQILERYYKQEVDKIQFSSWLLKSHNNVK
jgi:hypothetical protein